MLSTLGLLVLHWMGLTTLKQHNVVVEQSQVYRYRVFALRFYLLKLSTATPHDNIEKEINNVLDKDAAFVHSDMLD